MCHGTDRKRSGGALLGGAMAAWTLGCGSAPPKATPAPAPVAQRAVIAADLSEAPDPSHIVAILRWRDPNATLETVYRWTGIRLSGTDLLSQILDPNLASSLDLDAPVESVVALEPKAGQDTMPFFAVAVGVRSFEAARRAVQTMGPVTEVRPGEYRVSLRHNTKKKGDRPACLLAPARGPAPGRFMCGRRDRDIDALRGYLTRTLPERDMGSSDLHLELYAPPVLQVYGPMINQGLHFGAAMAPRRLEIGEPLFDRAIGRAALGISAEIEAVLGDLDKLTFDLALSPDNADARLALHFKNQQSWSVGTLANQATRASSVPPMFWSLPASASTAGFTYGPEIRRFEVIRRTLAELLDGWLLHEGVAPAERAPLTALFDDKYAIDSPWVSASGSFNRDPAIQAGAKGSTPPAGTPDPLQAAVDGFGWYLVGIATPHQIPEFFKNLTLAINRPKLQAFARNKLANLTAGNDTTQAAALSSTGFTLKSSPLPKELPRGSLSFELAITRDAPLRTPEGGKAAAKKQPNPPVKLHLLIVPESARTWLALAGDKARLVKTVLAAMEGSPQAGTLASREDLAFFKAGKYTSASFLTLESILESWLSSAARSQFDPELARTMGEGRSLLESSPHRGKTPMIMASDIALDNGLTWTTRLDVPKGAIEDVIILAASSRLLAPRP